LAIRLLTRVQVEGLEHFPSRGPAIIVSNHLGDTDFILGMAFSAQDAETMAKAELRGYPLLGALMDAYGVIWVHRGLPDRRSLRAALQGLAEGRFVALAPEGRESLSGSLETGTDGAAYLALKSGAPLLPATFTGTENANIFGSLRRWQRPRLTLTVGPLFHLEAATGGRQALHAGTELIMHTLARQLPPEYRGAYSNV
jgi:1-acyl-sn-glycerol-3-phosphate acyltransferase